MNVTVIARNRRFRAGSVTPRPLCVMLNIPPEPANYVADRPVRKMKIRKARIVAAIILSISLRSFSARFSLVYSNTCAHLVRERRHSIIRRVRLPSFGLATTVPPISPGSCCHPHWVAPLTHSCRPAARWGRADRVRTLPFGRLFRTRFIILVCLYWLRPIRSGNLLNSFFNLGCDLCVLL